MKKDMSSKWEVVLCWEGGREGERGGKKNNENNHYDKNI
jgi:hypothetical protein